MDSWKHYCTDCMNWQLEPGKGWYCKKFQILRLSERDRLCGGKYKE